MFSSFVTPFSQYLSAQPVTVRGRFGRADKLYFIGFLVMVLATQLALMSPKIQSLFSQKTSAFIDAPSVQLQGYRQFNSTYTCTPAPKQTFCVIRAEKIFEVPRSELGSTGILIADSSGEMRLLVNGTPIFFKIPVVNTKTMLFGMPVFVHIPRELLNEGQNSVVVALSSPSPLGAVLQRMYIGNVRALEPLYSKIFGAKWTVPRSLEAVLLISSMFALYVAIRHRDPTFIAIVFVSVQYLMSISADVLPTDKVELINQFQFGFRLSTALFLTSVLVLDADRPFFVSFRYLMLFPAVMPFILAQTSDAFELRMVIQIAWIAIIAFCSCVTYFLVRNSFRQRDIVEGIVLVIALSALILNIFNIKGTFSYPDAAFVGFRGYIGLFFIILILIRIFRSYSHYLRAAKLANQTLSTEVKIARQELAIFYEKDNAFKQHLLIETERQRLMGDLHDGLAGNLISINALAEYETNQESSEIRKLSHLALLDLRLVVDSLDTFDGELAVALAAFRERITPQYSGTKVELSWDYDHAPMITTLRPEVNLTIFRILQEAISNAVRHGHASRVHILVRTSKCAQHLAAIWILDNGSAAGFFAPGFGMKNMQRRAEKVNGKVYFRLGDNGSAVLLNIR